MKSEQLWSSLKEHYPYLNTWRKWSNKYGLNGMLVDEDDNTSFINNDHTLAIKISYEPDGGSKLDHWESEFGDEEMGFIQVLNVAFADLEIAKLLFNSLFNEWIKKFQ